MEQKTIDFTKPLRTRAGHKVRILCTDRKNPKFPIIALIEDEEGNEHSVSYTLDGKYWDDGDESNRDLFNVPEEKVAYINVYRYNNGEYHECPYDSFEEAERKQGFVLKRICMLRITTIEGQEPKVEVVA